MSEPTEREWLEGLRPEDEHEFYDRTHYRRSAVAEMTKAIEDVGPDQPLDRYAEAALDALLQNPDELIAAVRSAVSNETLYGWAEWRCFGGGPPCTAAEKFHLEAWPCGFYLALAVDKGSYSVPRGAWRGLTDTLADDVEQMRKELHPDSERHP